MAIRLSENFRALFYAPFYATHTLGFYAREGLDVELLTSNAPGDAVPSLVSGTIDLAWGGPMRVMKMRDQDPNAPLVCFCEVASHDPFFLIGRSERPFQLADLRNMRFASVSEVPTPWMCLQHDLRLAGIEPGGLARIADRTMDQNYSALQAGDLDVMQAFEPYASLAMRDGIGNILYAASSRGPTSYTAFIATTDGIARHREAFAAMARATAKMQQWLYSSPAEELAAAVEPFFPTVSPDILAASLRRYRDAGLWAHHPALSRPGFERLAQSLHSGGFITQMPSYEACVEKRLNEIEP